MEQPKAQPEVETKKMEMNIEIDGRSGYRKRLCLALRGVFDNITPALRSIFLKYFILPAEMTLLVLLPKFMPRAEIARTDYH